MTAPVWIASPPEVHSGMLTSGPGPGPLLSAAGVWSSLSAEYASVADELAAVLGAVQTGAWQGTSAEQYLAAHLPYLAWLTQASADSAGVAAQHEVAASAYTVALTTMPTLGELAANHATHGVLVATNFFGINTIPIALNEADYVRMWIQAAVTMSTYHAVSGAALASAPRTAEAPPVVKGQSAQPAAAQPSGSDFFQTLINQIGQLLKDPSGVIREILSNPAALIAWTPLLFFIAYEAFFIPFGFTFWGVMLGASIALPIAIPLGVAYLLNLDADPVAEDAPEPTPLGAAPSAQRPVAAVAGFTSGIATPGAAGVPAAGAPAAGAPPATTAGVAGFGYLVGGSDPGTSVGPTLTDGAKASAPAARVPAAAAAVGVSARDKARARRRKRAIIHDHADEFMDLTAGVPAAAETAGSDRGAGPLGFTGTVGKRRAARASGLATLAGDDFGGGPAMPMLPDTWGANDCADSTAESESDQ
ncbi:PPE family protein [Mycobacterium sp. M1]|uniref:PPE family protein n=1 Tax=Mycolicibacter acidiphilus TaxID=2835306 RepID=A0ABS5RRI1_9MYCO|nr:PPE family protein [Mycolicibacter acidiphilus]